MSMWLARGSRGKNLGASGGVGGDISKRNALLRRSSKGLRRHHGEAVPSGVIKSKLQKDWGSEMKSSPLRAGRNRE